MIHKKINDRIMEMFESGDFDYDFINLELDVRVKSKLHNYQHLHVYNLVSCLKKNNVIVDGSDTGTGKTYTAIACIKQLKLTPLIICPKGTINIWKNVCKYFDVNPLSIVNYEMLKNCNTYDTNNNIIDCDFLKNINDEYIWNFNNPKNIVVIFDEAHKCKNKSTFNSQLLLSLKNITKCFLISATLCDNPKNFTVFGYMLDYYDNLKKGKKWVEGVIREQTMNRIKGNILYKYIYPNKGSRMTIQDIGDNYPMNQISVDCFDLSEKDSKIIDNSYNLLNKMYKNKGSDSLVQINRERQFIELLKVPIFIDLIEKYTEHQKSIAIFVNYKETMNKIMNYLKSKKIEYCFIDGSQNIKEREDNVNNFQTNKIKIIICTIQSGGQSISLHDLSGNNPRVSIISPTFSSTDLIQTLGRIYRMGVKTPTLQIILFSTSKVERNISETIKRKIKFLDKLTDQDLFCNIFN